MLKFLRLLFCPRVALVAENLYLRKQLALFEERQARRARTTRSIRLAMVALSKLFDWREALVIVKPDTLLKWHRMTFKMIWRRKSKKLGRPPLPQNLRELIRQMDRDNPSWGEERISNELKLKLGILVSPRTVAKYLESGTPRGTSGER